MSMASTRAAVLLLALGVAACDSRATGTAVPSSPPAAPMPTPSNAATSTADADPTAPAFACTTDPDCNADLFEHYGTACGPDGTPQECPFACFQGKCRVNPRWNRTGGKCTSDDDCHPRDPSSKMSCSKTSHVCQRATGAR